jgi:hypothetical protein
MTASIEARGAAVNCKQCEYARWLPIGKTDHAVWCREHTEKAPLWQGNWRTAPKHIEPPDWCPKQKEVQE